MIKHFFLSLLLLSLAPVVHANVVGESSATYKEIFYEFKEMPQFLISAMVRNDGETLLKIRDGNLQLLQVLDGMTALQFKSEELLTLEDINFDGHPDLKLLGVCGSRGCSNSYWRYDAKTGLFVPVPFLSDKSVEVDKEHKEIVIREDVRSECSGCYIERRYRWSASDLIRTKETFYGIDPEHQKANQQVTIIDYQGTQRKVEPVVVR